MQLEVEAAEETCTEAYEYEEPGIETSEKAEEAIFTCKFPGCTRQYASTDGVRKHCRKSHPEWLREVDLDKANHGCRWAAYCTREAITESNDPRTTPVGSKRAREMMAQGGPLPPMVGGLPGALKSTSASFGADSSSTARDVSVSDYVADVPRVRPEPPKPRCAPHLLAMDGKSAIVPLRFTSATDRSSSSENLMPPEMIALPGELNTPLPANVSALTPNAQARARLGEIADSESVCLQGGSTTSASLYPTSPLVDTPPIVALQPANSFFTQWGMPPLKRGFSLVDTREAAAQHAMLAAQQSEAVDDGYYLTQDSPSFLDSVLA